MSAATATAVVIALGVVGYLWARGSKSITQWLMRLLVVGVAIGLVAQYMGGI